MGQECTHIEEDVIVLSCRKGIAVKPGTDSGGYLCLDIVILKINLVITGCDDFLLMRET